MSEKLEYDLLIKNNNLFKGLDDAIKKSSTLETALGAAIGVIGAGAVNKGFELIGNAINGAIGFAKDSVKAFSEQEDAINKLGQSLKSTGEFSNHAMDDFISFASAMQSTTKYGDELVLSQLAVAKSFGATNETAKKLVMAAAELDARFGGGLEANMDKLGKTLEGSAGKLTKYVGELKLLTVEQLRAGEAADVINKKFGGSAAAELNTYSGSVAALGNSYSDFQEEVGRLIAKNSFTVTSIAGLRAGFDLLTAAAKASADAMGIGITPLQQQQNEMKALGDEYNLMVGKVLAKRKELDFSKKSGADEIANDENIKRLNFDIMQFELRRLDILKERSALRVAMNEDKAVKAADAPEVETDKGVLDARAKLNDQLVALDQQLALERQTGAEAANNISVEKEGLRNEAELQRLLEYDARKQEIEFAIREGEVARIEDAEQRKLAAAALAKEKELALIKNSNTAQMKQGDLNRKNKEAAARAEMMIEQQKQNAIIGIIGSTASLAAALTKDGSKEQFLIVKAAAIAQAFVSTQMAAAMALAVPPAPNAVLSGYALAAGGINIAAIAATAIKGFATGGIIGGAGAGASIGPDDQTINARKGEMMLNADDQKFVFDFIKGRGQGSDTIIQIDGVTVFKAIRKVKQQGYSF